MNDASGSAAKHSAPASRRNGPLAWCAIAGLIAGGTAGAVFGYSPTPLVTIPAAECESTSDKGQPPRVDDRLREFLTDSEGFNFELAARVGSLEKLMESLRAQNVSASQLASSLTDGLTDDQLHDVLSKLARVDRYHLRDIEDVHDFGARLMTAALEGLFEPVDEDKASGGGKVLFSTERDVAEPSRAAGTVFPSDVDQINALIPVGDLENTQTVLKWIRLDPPNVVAFRRLGLLSEGEAYFAYGIRRSDALEPGRYRVEVFRINDELTPIASGSYAIQ
jgi:hypothetical protein